ncbi:MAG: HAD family phosphatase [Saccharothrix sp.]|nr:HAD family phosphatase [Saccharothrix sp.]
MLQWLVFDYGEVISHRSTAVPDLAASVGADPAVFEDAYWALRDAYDRGMSDADYWTAVGERAGFAVDTRRAAELTEADVRGWLNTAPDAIALLEDLSAAGIPMALLSNAPASCGRAFADQPWARHFRHLVVSADHATAKPDAAIWEIVTTRVGAPAAHCGFLDDRHENIEGARQAGLTAHHWTGAATARVWLTEQGLLAA